MFWDIETGIFPIGWLSHFRHANALQKKNYNAVVFRKWFSYFVEYSWVK